MIPILSAYTEFFSHPRETGILLQDHLLKVGEHAAQLILQTEFNGFSSIAMYAGLLHDIGKLNPYYQELFHAPNDSRSVIERGLLSKYERQHSIFSAWAANFMLRGSILESSSRNLAIAIIAGHHTKLSKRVSTRNAGANFEQSQRAIDALLDKFREILLRNPKPEYAPFSGLNWDLCGQEFGRPIKLQSEVKGIGSDVSSFLSACVTYSAVLQADRGSFGSISFPSEMDIELDTSSLIRAYSKLGEIRQQFQRRVLDDFDASASASGVSIIHAPTGIGKTKLFLDIIKKFQSNWKSPPDSRKSFEKVIYFSPLLALTEDFESKLKQVVKESKHLDDVLIYNHLFSGSLSEKAEDALQPNLGWIFENESFNRKFVVTTTQRLLITLYSNYATDKLKLVSFKNSLLILDEVQVVPKFLLPNLVKILKELCSKMNSKAILVSATVPYELLEAGLRIYGVSEEVSREYHALTRKRIIFLDPLALPSTFKGRLLVMANTRRKAKGLLEKICSEVQRDGSSRPDIHYLTTGIRKKTRSEILKDIRTQEKESVLVSTQVVEAGVDVSFTDVYREVAPLDNIVQVMGRLNREGEVESPTLHVFAIDNQHQPYSELEYRESSKIIRTVHDSEELYQQLPRYYRDVSIRNALNRDLAEKLESFERSMDFDAVWDFVHKEVMSDSDVPVIVPENEQELEEVRELLRGSLASPSGKLQRAAYRMVANITASLPRSKVSEIDGLLDPLLLERGIRLPETGCLAEMYDKQLGLDKWLK